MTAGIRIGTAPVAATDIPPRQQLASLMDRYEAPLCNYVRVLLHDDDAVRDCVQDTFLRAYEHLGKGKALSAQWLYTVARNRAIDQIRRDRRIERADGALDQLAGKETGSPDRAIKVRQILAQLAPADRELLYLAIVDRFSTDEIAAMLGIRAGAARVRLCRARERFRRLYRGAS